MKLSLAYRTVVSSADRDDAVEERAGTAVLTDPLPKVRRAPMYKVLLLNDDYTPMEFVVAVLERIFAVPRERAIALMLEVHKTGVGVAGVYAHEIAETKAAQVAAIAHSHEHPLQCTIEED
ncbi:MAG: ATP-dependent Clp protease adapter ClpS [Rhodobacteraceae bacterium]|nr:ATP-dependent Clp protease adapter ClpS [Paracoccaceae bacterium]